MRPECVYVKLGSALSYQQVLYVSHCEQSFPSLMLHLLPTEVTLSVLSYLPLPSLLSLAVLSRQWHDFFATNQSEIFHRAAILHEYIKPQTMLLEDALSVNTGRPWAGSTSWKDFCHRSFQLRKNWDGKGRAVMRLLSPPDFNVYDVMADERAGICITTPVWGGFTVIHLFSSIVLWCLPRSYVSSYCCDYNNGYLVFNNHDSEIEVWRLTSDCTSKDEVAANSPPNDKQMAMSARAAAVYHQYAPLGQFRPWALLRLPDFQPQNLFRLAYPTLICVGYEHTFLYDVRTGSLEQQFTSACGIPCDHPRYGRKRALRARLRAHVVHVISRESGSVVLRIPFYYPVPVHPKVDEYRCQDLIAARVSRDGCELVVLSSERRLVFVRDFERVCRGETTLEQAALVLGIPNGLCLQLVFKHGRVYVATVQGHYIFTFGSDRSVKAVYVRSNNSTMPRIRLGWTGCMMVTDRRIYFMTDERRRRDIPLFEDIENSRELPPPIPPTSAGDFEERPRVAEEHCEYVGCIDFSLMPGECDEERPEVANCPQSPVLVHRRAGLKISFVVTSNRYSFMYDLEI
ncbi:hypothetical protein EI94DRAFT_1827289 [Lactarius quietus]|nr:hypothetical protein EI94DRAFT_1827289 [Lactarius quietus]